MQVARQEKQKKNNKTKISEKWSNEKCICLKANYLEISLKNSANICVNKEITTTATAKAQATTMLQDSQNKQVQEISTSGSYNNCQTINNNGTRMNSYYTYFILFIFILSHILVGPYRIKLKI